jgi:phosphoglycolate phosphatase-like HAD superfamily hydrolase
VGDEQRDYEAAEALGLSFIQVSESATELESDLLDWFSQVNKQNGFL